MSYGKIYRGEFKNALADADNLSVDQTVRIDISDTSTGTVVSSMIGNVVIIGSTVLNFAPAIIIPTASLAERTAYWQTFMDFFTVGMTLRITGTPSSDDDYIVVNKTGFTPTNLVSDDPGSITIDFNHAAPGVSVSVHDVTFEDISTPNIIDLEMDGDPLHISIIDDDEDKFTPVRSKQAQIKIHTNSVIDIDTFCEGDDERFLVEIYVDELIVFVGFLIIPDMQQEFMPDPNVLVLAATDNLGTLKDQAMVDANDEYPIGKFKLIEFISWALRKTGIIKNINVVNNLKHGTGTFSANASFESSSHTIVLSQSLRDKIYEGEIIVISGTASNNGTFHVTSAVVVDILGFAVFLVTVSEALTNEVDVLATFADQSSINHFYSTIHLDAKTFEKQIGLGEDFYSVIRKILGEDSVLFQAKGEWWIVRIDEIEMFEGIFQVDVATFNSDGEYQGNTLRLFSKSIGVDERSTLYNDDPVIIPDRPYKFVKETYKYETPIEIICNIDFSRGEFAEDIIPTDQEKLDGAITAKRFELDDWVMMRGYPEAPGSPISNDSESYIKRLFNVVDYESSRYAVITSPSASNEATPYILSCALPVKKQDRFESSASFKFATNPTDGGGSAPIMQFALKGKDGSWWLLTIKDDTTDLGSDALGPRWVNTNGWTVNTSLADYQLNFEIGIDFSQWQNFSYDFKKVPPIPIDGDLYILLHGLNFADEAFDNLDVHWSNLSFNYYPFINGSYQKYTGQYHQVSQTTKNKAIRDNEVYMSDSPRELYKGAMLIPYDSTFVLAKVYTDHNHSIPKPYGEIQAYAVWNQYKNSARNFDANVDLIESDTVETGVYDGIDVIHKVDLLDLDKNTINRIFMILHYDQDFHLLAMKCFIASLFRTDIGKVYTDPHEFKYIVG